MGGCGRWVSVSVADTTRGVDPSEVTLLRGIFSTGVYEADVSRAYCMKPVKNERMHCFRTQVTNIYRKVFGTATSTYCINVCYV
jgi:hypothetical protein